MSRRVVRGVGGAGAGCRSGGVLSGGCSVRAVGGEAESGAFAVVLPLFQVMLAFQNFVPSAVELPGLTVSPVEVDREAVQFDLSMTLGERRRGVGMRGGCRMRRIFSMRATVRGIAERFVRVLDAVVDDPIGAGGRHLDRRRERAASDAARVEHHGTRRPGWTAARRIRCAGGPNTGRGGRRVRQRVAVVCRVRCSGEPIGSTD